MRRLVLLLWLVVSCGTNNLASPYAEDTPDEKAKKALDEGRYDDAIATYEELISADPEGYQRYALLSAAYAGKAGIDIVNILKAQLGGASSGGSVFELVGSFVPAVPSEEQLNAIQSAITTLEAMPLEHRSAGTYEYSDGAAFQLSLFLAASSVMVLNQFALPTGKFSPDSLADMSDAEVDAVLNNLNAIIATQASGEDQNALQAKAQRTLDGINSQDGSTSRERLVQYLSR